LGAVIRKAEIRQIAAAAGFDLAGVAEAVPVDDGDRFLRWAKSGMAGEMRYLTDRRADIRLHPRRLLPSAKTVICVARLYNGPEPLSTELGGRTRSWISRYAWGDDYHDVMRRDLTSMVARLTELAGPFDSKICVDTAPFLDVAYARRAGLGWIGRNTCLINQPRGSWFFLGAALTSLDLEPDAPPPDRCGSCRRCIDACPTQAIVPFDGGWTVDARRCISYLTIELRGSIPENLRPGIGRHVFGCDICQDVCPWNWRAPQERDECFAPRLFAPPLDKLARLSREEFRKVFRGSPVARATYPGFLRNVTVAMGNSGNRRFVQDLQRLADGDDAMVAEHADWALRQLG
jgi:epoxyqueuosine reductase